MKDEGYCNEIKRKKTNYLLNNLLVYGLKWNDDEVGNVKNFLYLELKHKIYLNWLINKNIQIKYFTNICNTIAYSKYNKIQTVFSNLQELDLSYSEISGNDLNNIFICNQINNIKTLNFTDCNDQSLFKDANFKALIETNIYIKEIILDRSYASVSDEFIVFIFFLFVTLQYASSMRQISVTSIQSLNNIFEIFNGNS